MDKRHSTFSPEQKIKNPFIPHSVGNDQTFIVEVVNKLKSDAVRVVAARNRHFLYCNSRRKGNVANALIKGLQGFGVVEKLPVVAGGYQYADDFLTGKAGISVGKVPMPFLRTIKLPCSSIVRAARTVLRAALNSCARIRSCGKAPVNSPLRRRERNSQYISKVLRGGRTFDQNSSAY